MKTIIQQHLIDQQRIILNIDGNISESDFKALQQEIVHLYKTKIGEQLDRIFTELVPADVHIKLDKLEIKLPEIDLADFKNLSELSRLFEKYFNAAAKKIIKEKILKASKGKLERSEDGRGLSVSKWSILETFLEDGHYPSWASLRNQSIDKIFEELMNKSPTRVAQLVADLSKKNRSKLIDRIIYQFRAKYVDRLMTLIYQKDGREALKLVEAVRRRLGQRYQAMRGQKSVNKAIMTAAFEYALEQLGSGKKLKFSEKELTQYIVEAIQSKYRHVDESDVTGDVSGVKNEFSNQFSDLDVLEYFLSNGSIPYWASTESRQSVQELFNRLTLKRLTALQRMVEKHLRDETFIRRLVMQFSTEQIYLLLEPLAEDNRRFIAGLLQEFQRSGFNQTAAKQAAIELIIGQRGRFSKEALTREALEKAAASSGTALKEMLSDFYGQLQQRALTEYDLTRSELIRVLNEIDPELASGLEILVQKRRQAKAEESALLARIEELKQLIEGGSLKREDREKLKRERKQLRRQLSELREKLQKIGIAAPDSAAAIAEKKNALERQLSTLKRLQNNIENNLQNNIENNLQNNIDNNQQNSIEYNLQKNEEEQLEILQQLRDLNVAFVQLQEKLLLAFEKAQTPQQREKLRDEFEHSLGILLRERSRLQVRLTELEANLNLKISNSERRALKKQEKRLKEEIKTLDERINKIEQVAAAIKATSEEQTEEEDIASQNSKLDFLIFFLQYGSIPWWAEEYKDSSVEAIFKEFAETETEKLRQAFARVGRNPVVWQRLVNQLSEDVLEKVLVKLFPNFAGFAISVAIMLQKIIEAKILPSLEGVSVKYFKWSKVTETLFTTPSSFNPQSFVKAIVSEIGREFNIAPTTLLEYMTNLSNNNEGTRLAIFADIVRPLIGDADLLEVEKELIETAFRRRQEEEGLVIPEDKKYDVLSEYLLKGIFADLAFKAGYSSAAAMEQLFLELLGKQPSTIEKLLEKTLSNAPARRRLGQEFSDEVFWEIVLLIGAKTMPLVKKYIRDLGLALGDERMAIAKDALLRYIQQSGDKPFIMRDYLNVLLKDAVQVTQRQRIAIINEWKRKVYQTPSTESSLILALMQVEIQDLKEQTEATEDQSEKDNLQSQMQLLQMEYQQQSQRMVYIQNKEQAQVQGDFEIPEDTEELYQRIDEVTKEIEGLRSKMVENPRGEELLQQILSWKQIAMLEGQLELLQQNEPFLLRQLKTQRQELDAEIQRMELTSAAPIKIPTLPPAPEVEELEQLADDLGDEGYLRLRERMRRLPEDERADWIDLLQEMGWDDILKQWTQEEEKDDFLKALPKLSLEELSKAWDAIEDKNTNLQRRVQGRLRALIAKRLQTLRKAQKELLENIEKADSSEKVEELRRQFLNIEMQQNDALNDFFAAPLNNNLRQSLQRAKNNIRLVFQRLRAAAERRKAELLAAEQEKNMEEIKQKKELREQVEKAEREVLEQLKMGKKPKTEGKVKAEKKAEKKPDKPIDEALYIRNAGLVLLHPYFNRLFTTLNLVEKNKFVSDDAKIKGVHLLQYIATGKTEHPENELVLNKLICGLPLSTPVPMDIGLSEDELRVAAGLLQGAIANWPRMKTMSPDALRGTFLLREGNIKEESDRWKLKIEKGSFDILLKTIPWAYSFVRLGWMPKFIMVEWPLPG